MMNVFNELQSLLGSHYAVSEALEYSDRQYRNIRRLVENGEPINPRVKAWILNKYKQLQKEHAEHSSEDKTI